MEFNFKNKIVVITGGSRGIGKFLVDEFLRRGSKVFTNSRNRQTTQRLNKIKNLTCINADFLTDKDIKFFIHELKNVSKIDILINNAGINEIDTIDNYSEENWKSLQQVNLHAPFYLISKLAVKIKKSKFGRIINVSSIFGSISKEKRSAYSATKSGIIGLTRGASLDLAKYKVLVNAVSPGFVDTQLTKRILNKDQIESIKTQIPLKRLASPEEIVNLILFLCSESNSYITGQNILIDGGFTIK